MLAWSSTRSWINIFVVQWPFCLTVESKLFFIESFWIQYFLTDLKKWTVDLCIIFGSHHKYHKTLKYLKQATGIMQVSGILFWQSFLTFIPRSSTVFPNEIGNLWYGRQLITMSLFLLCNYATAFVSQEGQVSQMVLTQDNTTFMRLGNGVNKLSVRCIQTCLRLWSYYTLFFPERNWDQHHIKTSFMTADLENNRTFFLLRQLKKGLFWT